jgi:5'-deoxynucleotidase YfbR-like HD superfamily hydrolase
MIKEIRSGFNVRRFHTTHRIQEETVGHHSANVCAILLRLQPDVSRSLLVAALFHDVAEVYTGDVPAPFKWDNPHMAEGLKQGELDYFKRHKIPAPTEWEEMHDEDLALLKLADMLELVLSSMEEINRGNLYAAELVANGQDYIEAMDIYPEYKDKVEDMVWEVRRQWQLTTNK